MAGVREAGRRTLVVAGHGMVGHRLLELLAEAGALREWEVVVFCEERHLAYDRVHLTSFLTGTSAAELSLVGDGFLDLPGLTVRVGEPVVEVDRVARTVRSALGRVVAYDALALATGSYPFVPPVPGRDATGCFTYRTIDDLEAIAEHAAGCRSGAVVGGGLLGLEAANALLALGLETHVVEFAPRLMPLQVDDVGGAVLRRHVEALGITVHAGCATSEVVTGDRGQVVGMRFAEGAPVGGLDADLVVFSAGIRPRDDLARAAGLAVHERGGVLVDETCRTDDPAVFAIGECAVAAGRTWGLVAPGYLMAGVVADQLAGSGTRTFSGVDLSTKLKLLGVEVASFGDAFGATEGSESVTFTDHLAGVHRRLVIDPVGGRVLGGVLVGDASGYEHLVQLQRGDLPTPAHLAPLVIPVSAAFAPDQPAAAALAGTATVCSCNNVTRDAITAAVAGGCTDAARVKACTRAGSTCGGCVPLVAALVKEELRRSGATVDDGLCAHFPHTRQGLFDLLRVGGITTFGELLARHGTGLGCEVCKPAVASMLATSTNAYILDGEQASLQDTNDHHLANLQRDGTYSVVPRVPGGEITADQLIAIGQVAKDFDLYAKITGGQRIDLLGARVEQLPAIWQRLVDVGMESGHAYGKALRTVKSCVGEVWCRYGVADSTTMAIRLEERYRGLRAPHKIKLAVSGCARECAEAQSKDVGVIATESGWNLYVAGNGGMRPRHGTLLATDLDDEALVHAIDRFLLYYVRTADRLQRTSTWFEALEGGVDHVRAVIFDDVLGIADQLDEEVARHVDTYRDEWAETLASPARLARFTSFVNTDEPDPTIVHVRRRGQTSPARPEQGAAVR